GRQSSRSRLDVAIRRSHQGRTKDTAIRCAQSEYAGANPNGWRLRAVGIKRHWPISGVEAAGERADAQRRVRPARRDALAVLGPRALGAGVFELSARVCCKTVHLQVRRTRSA